MEESKAIVNILAKARELEGKSLSDLGIEIYPESASSGNSNGKGSFGQQLEQTYFGIMNNSRPEPDFWPIPLELKVAPLKRNEKTGFLVPKERIVLGIINYFEVVNETFNNSHFKFKNETILIVWYIYNKIARNEDLKIDISDIWRCIQEDGKQIEDDWNTIVDKVKNGHAEDISEGDTLFVGACTKGATRDTSYRKQPYSDVLAKQRAFCFKLSYVNHIYEVLKNREQQRGNPVRFVSPTSELNLEQTVQKLFSKYIGMNATQIEDCLNFYPAGKSIFASLARAILGYSKKNKTFYEFDAANIQIKTIRVELNGKIKEDMSFKNIKFKDMLEQEWEDSDLYQELVSKFIFVVFRKEAFDNDYHLSTVKFWNMPEEDLDQTQIVWEKTKYNVSVNNFDNLPKKKDSPIIHVRTKGKDSSDLVKTPFGTYVTKRCFFLNNTYIKKVIKQ